MKKRPYILIICSFMVVACGFSMPVAANPQAHGVTQAQLDSLAEIMNQAVEQEQIAGGSFLVAHKGEVVFREAFGYADIEAKRPFTTEELLPVASISKPFLASVMMALVDQGKLKLDDPVEKYLPEFKGKKVKGSQSPARPMTVRHLLSHTGGFWANQKATPEMRRAIYKYRRPLSEAVNGIAKFDLVYEPGTKFVYSGAGHCVAGRVAEVALGDQSLEKIAQDVLFRPLGLNRTTWLPSKEARKAAPPQYLRVKGKLQKQPTMGGNVDVRLIRPGGSLFTTLDEIAALGQMHLNDGVYNGRRILSKESVTEMRRLQVPDGSNKNYGLCWNRDDVSEAGLADLVFHGGARGGLLRIDRKRETVTVFLVHSSGTQVQQILEDLNQRVEQIFSVGNDR
jgi:CubicO group peptidase (beta-lactamase class C family)